MIVVVISMLSGVTGVLGSYDRLVASGAPARGILLWVAPQGVRVPSGNRQRPFERRQMVIDVEIPGQAPYEINVAQQVPLNLVPDCLPGATVELRVDRKNPQRVAIVGPGAFFAAQLLGQARAA
ncbi:MAG: hypothetical protein K8W52_23510 [Deltaproteobacteria bacterium]|nr:hypothetical protein [Deltaproteobacteria bacterium]